MVSIRAMPLSTFTQHICTNLFSGKRWRKDVVISLQSDWIGAHSFVALQLQSLAATKVGYISTHAQGK